MNYFSIAETLSAVTILNKELNKDEAFQQSLKLKSLVKNAKKTFNAELLLYLKKDEHSLL